MQKRKALIPHEGRLSVDTPMKLEAHRPLEGQQARRLGGLIVGSVP